MLSGRYNSQDPHVARQHGYQLVAMGASGVIVDWTNCNAQREYPLPWQPGDMAECVANMPPLVECHSEISFKCVVFHSRVLYFIHL